MDNLILKPEILTHPNIPKPLHGLNPRTLLGKEWWDHERFEAQKRTGYRCIACGVRKYEAKKYHWLEGHEYWDIDYNSGICKVVSIEPLCHYCHNFIHSGRLMMIMNKEKTELEVRDILEHGFRILHNNNLLCFPYTLELAIMVDANFYGVDSYQETTDLIPWDQWVLVLNGKEYHSKFANIQEWAKYYENYSGNFAQQS